jgi:hypothetical protein
MFHGWRCSPRGRNQAGKVMIATSARENQQEGQTNELVDA